MNQSAQRDLVVVSPEWSIPQVQIELVRALNGDGPALAFGPTNFSQVPVECAVVIPTSGSTGNPKEVALSADSLIASAHSAHTFIGASAGEKWSLLLPINHIAGVNVLVRAIALKSEILNIEESADYTSIVPTQLFRALNGDALLLEHLKNSKRVLVGGAAISQNLLKQAHDFGISVTTSYGMTEMCGGCVYDGSPLEGVEIEIKDGAIALKGPTMAIGYLGEAPFKVGSWFTTSDLGSLEDGKLVVHGRADDVIISGGEKVSLSAVTDFLGEGFVAFAVPHEEWGQALVIASDQPINESEITHRLISEFGSHVSPKGFLSQIELPRTSLGKPDRQALIQIFERIHP